MRKINKLSLFLATVIVALFMSFNTVQASIVGNGIDISNWQPSVNYSSLQGEGIKYVYVKATQGVDYIDNCRLTHYWGAKSSGLKVGFYHYMSPYTDPTQQAIDFYNSIKDLNYDLYPCLDIEDNPYQLNKVQMSSRVLTFLNKFYELSSQKCIIYSGSYFAKDYLNENIYNNYNFWIACYGTDSPIIPEGLENSYVGWQYTDSGSYGGNYPIDTNIFTEAIELGKGNSTETTTYNYVDNSEVDTSVDYASSYIGDRCLELQQKLNQAFNYGLAEDGLLGSNTRNAILEAQTELNIVVDGLFGTNSWTALESYLSNNSSGWISQLQTECNNQGYSNQSIDNVAGPVTLEGCPYLKIGNQGNITKLVQESLGTTADGIFGSQTRQAVIKFQANNELVQDGIVGRNTWRKLLGL